MDIWYYPIFYIYIYIYVYVCIYELCIFFVYCNIVATHTHDGHTGFTFTQSFPAAHT